MSTLEERKRRGEDIVRRYRRANNNDQYTSAVDAIADILLFVAQSETEATQLLQSAEMDFRNEAQAERFLTEG
jgi:hypothetical protein